MLASRPQRERGGALRAALHRFAFPAWFGVPWLWLLASLLDCLLASLLACMLLCLLTCLLPCLLACLLARLSLRQAYQFVRQCGTCLPFRNIFGDVSVEFSGTRLPTHFAKKEEKKDQSE